MKYTTYLFDFDGTLVDSMPYWAEKMIRVLELYGVDYPADIIKTITPLGDRGTAIYFKEVLGVNANIEDMLAQMDEYAFSKYHEVIILKPGVADLLTALKNNGDSLNILTASPHKMVNVCLQRLGIMDWFDHLWCCDDFGKSKSDPSIYIDAAKQLNEEPCNIVFFDDNIHALKAANAAGLCTVGVYDPFSDSVWEEIKAITNNQVVSFRETSLFGCNEG